jgi:small basic protein (TIGR04137 family)
MSLDRSLKTKPAALNQHRNVLTRAERIARLADEGEFKPGDDSPIGLVKVANRQIVTGKKKKKKEEEPAAEVAAPKAE